MCYVLVNQENLKQKRRLIIAWTGRFLEKMAKKDLPINMTFGRCRERSEESACDFFRKRIL